LIWIKEDSFTQVYYRMIIQMTQAGAGARKLQGIFMHTERRATGLCSFHKGRMLQLMTSTGLALFGACGLALAQSASPGSSIVLDPIIIGADDNAALKSASMPCRAALRLSNKKTGSLPQMRRFHAR